MKKKTLIPLALLAAIGFTSCDSKLCYCYEATATGVMEQETYIANDTPCNAISNSSRTCVESNERMDPGMIAWK